MSLDSSRPATPAALAPAAPDYFDALLRPLYDVDWAARPTSVETIAGPMACRYREDEDGQPYVALTVDSLPSGWYVELDDRDTYGQIGGFRFYADGLKDTAE